MHHCAFNLQSPKLNRLFSLWKRVECVMCFFLLIPTEHSLEKACASIGNGTTRLENADKAWALWQSTHDGSSSETSTPVAGEFASSAAVLGGAIEAVQFSLFCYQFSLFCYNSIPSKSSMRGFHSFLVYNFVSLYPPGSRAFTSFQFLFNCSFLKILPRFDFEKVVEKMQAPHLKPSGIEVCFNQSFSLPGT